MTVETSAWTNPRNGETRYYINNLWTNILGLEITRYKTGNISSATLAGEAISNSKAGRLSGKLWADENGGLHIDYFQGMGFITEEEALEKIAAYIKENGGLDFMPAEEAEEEAAEAAEDAIEDAAIFETQAEETTTQEIELWDDGLDTFYLFTGAHPDHGKTPYAETWTAEMEFSARNLAGKIEWWYTDFASEMGEKFPTPSREHIYKFIRRVLKYYWVSEEETEEFEACQGITAAPRPLPNADGVTFTEVIASGLGAQEDKLIRASRVDGSDYLLAGDAPYEIVLAVKKTFERMMGLEEIY